MKKIILIVVLGFFWGGVFGQMPDEWTWMNGAQTMNYLGNYGTMGVANPTNKPPGVYEAIEWTDNHGNFWFYGGEGPSWCYNDLWKYNVATNKWTWMKGSGGLNNQIPIYGTRGVSSPINTPGVRVESSSWKDNQGNFWLYGGLGFHPTANLCQYNDLWKYTISTNSWTWIKGDSTPAPYCGYIFGNWGIKGVEDTLNNPPYMDEMDLTWTDNNDNLWMQDFYGCLWKYKMATNNWIWMNGDTTGITVYGQKGIASINTTPGIGTIAYTRWRDSNDNFWVLYAKDMALTVIFKYEINSNMWTWIWGDTINVPSNPNCHYGDTLCDLTFEGQNENVVPFPRIETRACWIDNCDNLWLMGGHGGNHSTFGDFDDLIYFDTHISKWVWVGNDTTINNHSVLNNSIFGTIGVSSPFNKPTARNGAIPFKDTVGNLWLYGGTTSWAGNYAAKYGDLWKFTMDNGCPPCHGPYDAGIAQLQKQQSPITLSPNPFTSSFTLTFSETPKNASLKVMNILGEVVLQSEIKNLKSEINLSNQTSGMYFVNVQTDKGTMSRKVIKK